MNQTCSTLLITILSLLNLAAAQIIPAPFLQQEKDGHFLLTKDTVIVAPKEIKNETDALVNSLSPATDYQFKVQQDQAKGSQIQFIETPSMAHFGQEGYQLEVTPERINIKYATNTGAFYAVQSLLQLLPAEIVSVKKQELKWQIACIHIADKPRFSWRALMLDEARHFKGVKEVKKTLDQMASLKMNVFHWHLTDDQGWRIEIKKYPKLTTIGSKRKDTQTGNWKSKTSTGKPHGGFYTQEQIKEIVAYAKARHINIVPEIGMPGHATAAIAAYPQLGTNKKQVEVWTSFGKSINVYDPSSEFTYQFMSDVFDEVFALFPAKIIHIGGDEVRFDHWKQSKSVQALMKKENLKTMADVQMYFTNRIGQIVQKKGRNIMGWNDILGDDLHGFLKDGQTAKAGKLDKNTIVHFWKGSTKLAKRAVKDGHTIVNSIHSSTYLDYGYGSISLAKAYNFDPIIGGLTPDEEERIIGTGCQMWSEWIPTVEGMERQIYPRLAAYAEVGWTPKQKKDFASFKKRMKRQSKVWDIQGIHYAKGQVAQVVAADFFNHQKVDTWNPKRTPKDWQKLDFNTEDRISAAGNYEIAYVYTKGKHALNINEVSLLEDGVVVATDKHNGFSGGKLDGIVYTLKLPTFKKGATYIIQANIKGGGGTHSHGEVKIRSVE